VTAEVAHAIQRNVPSEAPDGARKEAALNGTAGRDAVSVLPSRVKLPASMMPQPGSLAELLSQIMTSWRPRLLF
jgi:hypothetical protein